MALSDRPRSRYEETLGDTGVPSEWIGARMTLKEFLALPEEKPYLEWDASLIPQKDQVHAELMGVVTQKMAPQDDHSLLTDLIMGAFHRFGSDRRLGLGHIEKRFKLVGWAPVPDVSFYRRERLRPQ